MAFQIIYQLLVNVYPFNTASLSEKTFPVEEIEFKFQERDQQNGRNSR
jgi:hypothetical protein